LSQIVTLTVNPAIDRILRIEHVTPDRKLRCSSSRRDAGGGGVNVTRGIHILGGDSLAIYTCGGYTGGMYRQILEAEGLPNLPIDIEGLTREHIMVLETSTGRDYRFGEDGPVISRDEAIRCLQAIADYRPVPDYLVLSGSLPPGVGDEFYAQIIRATDPHTRIIIDTTANALAPALEERVFLIKPNAAELSELVGHPVEGRQEIEAVSRELVAQGKAEVVVASLGAGGAVLVSEDLSVRVPAPAVRVESKVGAGDSMVAGLVLALDRGESLLDAVRFGTAAGAAAVMDAETGLGSRQNAERLYAEMLAEA
jgi:6-phosphofructokinase 2